MPYISHIETGNKNVSLVTLVEIGNVFSVTIDVLLLGNQEHDQTEYEIFTENVEAGNDEQSFIKSLVES